ncbi:MAG: hypothetical protein KDB60_14280 [Propionibacteriaceae bacterium]|nr:hypothetical protein [Propionibacteriaceae bacterium]
MRRLLLAAALTATLAASAAASTTTQASPLPQAATCSGVWVVVDYGSLGGTSTKCATSFGTGTKALRSAGFSVTMDEGFVLKVNGKPANPDPNTAYWSYWHAAADEDGSWGAWSYSSLGADSYHPTTGAAEGWRYQRLSDGKVPPGVKPPVATTPTPTPTPTKTTTKPSAKPTRTATKTATASATRTTSAHVTATKSATAKKKPKASAEPSLAPSATTATTEATPLGTGEMTIAAEQVDEAPLEDGGGSPIGLVVAGVVIVLAGGGLGGWSLWKGRKP